LKLRVGAGLTGNDQIPSFQFLNAYASGFNYRSNPGTAPDIIPNPDVKWEQTIQYNAGLNIGLLKDRLSITADIYYKETNDLLLNRPIPGSSGFPSVVANIGSLENKGLELALSGVVLESPLKWTTNFNISFNRNKVTALYNNQPITEIGRGNNAVIVGQPVGSFFMYESLGVDPSTGNLVFRDVDINGTIDGNDRKVVGNPNPDFTGGFTNNLSYAGFDLSVFLQFVVGNEIYNGVRQYAENMTFGENDNQLTTVKQRWKAPGDRVPVPKANGLYNNDITSHYIEDGSFLRLKSISLGYTLPTSFSSKAKIQRARIYITAQNIWVLTNYSGFDPEVNYAGIDPSRAGTDFFTYPQPRTIMGGINLKF
jgi:TonB-dependent starch-binding outer membrane protein SusC